MILYHGSTECVDNPEIRKGDVYLDFGVGFYTTTSFEQAMRWAKIKMKRNRANLGYVSVYEFDMENAERFLNIKRFECANEEWLNFVVNNRSGNEILGATDLYIGPSEDNSIGEDLYGKKQF